MTLITLVRQSLRFHWRAHLGLLAGTCLGCAVLTGSLVVGDSERHLLDDINQARLGATQMALVAEDKFFRAALAAELESDLKATAAPVLSLRGSAALPDGRARANDVQVLGVDEQFWKLGGSRNLLSGAAADEVALNSRLARQLGVQVNDVVILRVEPPSLLSRDAPLSGRSDTSVALRGRVRAIAKDADFGRFSLQANQVSPATAFVPLAALQALANRPGQANLLLTAAGTNAAAAFSRHWTLADAGLQVKDLPVTAQQELRTDRIFLDPVAAEAALAIATNASGVLTYFVNEFRLGDRTTPYSFITATGSSLGADEIRINSWLAEDLDAKVGDRLTLRYFIMGERRQLVETNAAFQVAGIEPVQVDSSWMPDFPGLAGAENCRDWEPGTPIDTTRIRPKDEAYWHQYRGTPKAFISLSAGQRLWANRFGNLTAARYPASIPMAAELRQRLTPAALGLNFIPVRIQAIQSSPDAMALGGLFVGFSFFLIVAALLLSALLHGFNLEQRREERGLLRALGFAPRRVQRLMLLEGGVLALGGTVLGLAVSVPFTLLALHGLSTIWQSASGLTELHYHTEPATLLLGAALSLAASAGTIWLVQRQQLRRTAVELLTGERTGEASAFKRPGGWGAWLGVFALLAALGSLFGAHLDASPEVFFTAGSLLLLAGVGFSQQLLAHRGQSRSPASTLAGLAWRNATRQRGRSLATITILASGVFLVIAVGAFRQEPERTANARKSGTGGFAHYARSALPIYDDLNDPAVQNRLNLPAKLMSGVSVVPLRVHQADDASCLNLNHVRQPSLLGVEPAELTRRQAFAFGSSSGSWELLSQPDSDGAIPAIGDEQTVTWALGKKLGDTLQVVDGQGKEVSLRIVALMPNSVLQGSLVLAAQAFEKLFPDSAGYRLFLVDAPADRAVPVAAALSQALQDRGLEVMPAGQRLAELMAVENTYLAIFQTMGWLGLLLGSIGLGIVVSRNILERRGELALMQAVGFRPSTLLRILVLEHSLLIVLGLLIGLVAAGLATAPALLSGGGEFVSVRLALTVSGLGLGGVLWTWLAARAALRGPLLPALRNE